MPAAKFAAVSANFTWALSVYVDRTPLREGLFSFVSQFKYLPE